MENEENRGHINKKAYEDQFMAFGQFNFGVLSLFSLSHTLEHLEFSWSTSTLDQERKRRKRGSKRSSKIEQDQAATSGLLAGIYLHV